MSSDNGPCCGKLHGNLTPWCLIGTVIMQANEYKFVLQPVWVCLCACWGSGCSTVAAVFWLMNNWHFSVKTHIISIYLFMWKYFSFKLPNYLLDFVYCWNNAGISPEKKQLTLEYTCWTLDYKLVAVISKTINHRNQLLVIQGCIWVWFSSWELFGLSSLKIVP